MEPKEKNTTKYSMSKIITYVLTILIAMLLLPNSYGVQSLNFVLKIVVYICVIAGGVLGGCFGLWLNERCPYIFDWIAEKFNMENSIWFRLIGAQVIGIIAGIVLFGGTIARIIDIKI